eukprot:scaffold495_cov405-Prasinococcus_capsulatus_cf.AAC.9
MEGIHSRGDRDRVGEYAKQVDLQQPRPSRCGSGSAEALRQALSGPLWTVAMIELHGVANAKGQPTGEMAKDSSRGKEGRRARLLILLLAGLQTLVHAVNLRLILFL